MVAPRSCRERFPLTRCPTGAGHRRRSAVERATGSREITRLPIPGTLVKPFAPRAPDAYGRRVRVREERPTDQAAVRDVHREAFGAHSEMVVPLVDDLRRSLDSEPGLSLVA